ncbi:hypothetical protein FQ707_10985 [Bacteroidaceae bacterium HV4-6-C5C]|jgi:hypothetical protein|nr:hypothetical protein FQ707_10985 [Bacteroidaceae bacterium HV4-6-C5C]
MKNIFKYMAGVLIASAGFAMAACSPEEYTGANGNIPQVSDYSDNFKVSVDQETNNAKFEFTSAPGVTPVWIIDGTSYSSAYNFIKYYRKKGSYTVECKVKNANGISDGSVVKTFEVEKTKMTGFPGFVEDSQYNLFKGIELPNNPGNNDDPTHNPGFWYAPGWSQIAAPQCVLSKGAYTVTLPTATTDRWQAQMAIKTGLAISAGKHYDFSVILTSNVAHKGVKVKICQADNDNLILLDKDFALEAGEPKALWGSDLEGADMSNVKIVFDFGGNASNTEINIESFVLKDHANDDGTKVPNQLATPFDYNDAGNIWKAVDTNKAFTEETYFGDANWNAIPATPAITHEGSKHTIIIPVATPAEEWHAQWKLYTELPAAANATVDFSLKVNSSIKLPGMTVKLTDPVDDGNFFFAVREALPSGDYVFRIENAKLAKDADVQKLLLVFDFGGAPEGAVITVSDITLIKK